MPFIRTWWGKHHKEKQLRAGAQLSPTPQEQLGAALEVNLAIARELKEKSNDIVIREFCLWDRRCV